jgi:hypothetical protein
MKMQTSVGPTSPLDVNIDTLLDLPEEKLDFVEPEAATVVVSAQPTPPPPPIDDEFTPVSLVGAPRMPPPARKTSQLDEYQVEIRRPGKRV